LAGAEILRVLAVVLTFGLCASAVAGARDDADSAARVFGPDKVWIAHLQVTAKDWAAMVPTKSFFGPVDKTKKGKEETRAEPMRGGFGFDFAYVEGEFEFDGKKWADVGVRFKGNSSFAMSGKTIKKPFKVDFNRYVKGQDFHGLEMINLANNYGEPAQVREALAFAVFRAAGVPSPRTAFVELYLTVLGQHQREFVGLYTLIEQVDKTFLKNHFKDGAGMLLKPEGFMNLPYLGPDWKPYAEMYRPKDEPDAKAKQRLIDFTRLVNFADNADFNRSISKFLDVDRYLRYVAACSVMVNVDSFIGLGHNYYLYLDPNDNRFTFLPWDLNATFGMFPTVGGANLQTPHTIAKPYFGRNRLTERLLAAAENEAVFRKHLGELNAKTLSPAKLIAEIDVMQKAVQKVIDKENARKKSSVFDLFTPKPPDLKKFVNDRSASIDDQLAGKAEGKEVNLGFFDFGKRDPLGKQVVKPLLAAIDTDRDGKLLREEVKAAVKQRFDAWDGEAKGALTETALANGLAPLMPKPPPNPILGDKFPNYGGVHFAGLLFARAGIVAGKLSLTDLQTQADRFFADTDTNGDDALDEAELNAALDALPPLPVVWGRSAPDAKKEDRK
jgi:spore coat protein CotH